ncbi:MerR family transcriptional regulator [Paenibacillus sp. SYP-B3998]|uniref:MerR family transcriptional regulator n=1 Tax=Paenibacillus sp. SYP-B3998 TaxID=2678564 RepID=A0A6G3ZSN5_9BACL|nr:MerR family transcriptional regulator [Paenibacillus sp. SYP-B3998]NEW04599.1 MerR family transcriptional regulator [Paenibacillus sp. SYP-B3998]
MTQDENQTYYDFDLLSKLVVGIGEVSEITGVPTRKIRYWEDKGIVCSVQEADGSTRRYDYLNIKKIVLVQELVEDGYTLDAAAKKVEDRMKNINDIFQKMSEKK